MHTQGKWEMIQSNMDRIGHINDFKILEDSIEIATVSGKDKARLIVSAPELLEACKSAQEYIFEGGNSRIVGGTLNKAIAKAEGK